MKLSAVLLGLVTADGSMDMSGLENLANNSEVSDNPCAAPYTDFSEVFDRCYFVSAENKNWADAQAECVSQGGSLPVPENAEQNSWLLNLITEQGLRRTFLGIDESQGEGQWTTSVGQQELAWTNWNTVVNPSRPIPDNTDLNYGFMYNMDENTAGLWGDFKSDVGPTGFICIQGEMEEIGQSENELEDNSKDEEEEAEEEEDEEDSSGEASADYDDETTTAPPFTTADYTTAKYVDHDSADGECGCTCLTAEEKQRWLRTMDEYERKLAEWTRKYEEQNNLQ